MSKKIILGQFNTSQDIWLKKQILEFIKDSKMSTAFDPFAGKGDLIKISDKYDIYQSIGMDIDLSLNWKFNDSLLDIPFFENTIIITNPPYLAKQSAKRRKLNLDKYFEKTTYDDLYLIALDRMTEKFDHIVAIIPESFLNSNYEKKDLIHSITIIEDNPFYDTEVPVCVVCFDGISKDFSQIKIFKNEVFIDNYKNIINSILSPKKNIKMNFNDLSGWLGIRAVDSSDDSVKIKFDFKDSIRYDWESRIKVSSRHFTLVKIDVNENKRNELIIECNNILNNIRNRTSDLVLTPFMGNTKKGIRRRRLDFALARAIIEIAYNKIIKR
jgi:hypothetical protein